jgi:hypothetical protein
MECLRQKPEGLPFSRADANAAGSPAPVDLSWQVKGIGVDETWRNKAVLSCPW